MERYPSNFDSCTHSLPSGTVSDSVASCGLRNGGSFAAFFEVFFFALRRREVLA